MRVHRQRRLVHTTIAIATGLLAVVLAIIPAQATPYSSTDRAYLSALDHGGLCCAWQPDKPIPYPNPDDAVAVGKFLATLMTRSPSYLTFNNVRHNNIKDFGLNDFDAGMITVIAMRFYAVPSVEQQVRAQMRDEQYYWYGQA